MATAQQLIDTARELVAPARGILAADESTGTIGRRLDSINVENTEAHRRDYREMLFRTEGAAEYISGIILYDETIRQDATDGTPLMKVLTDQGIIPGIKVDTGAKALVGAPGEQIKTAATVQEIIAVAAHQNIGIAAAKQKVVTATAR